jgi:hypothetical protein
MKPSHVSRARCLGVALALAASTASGQSYGPAEQKLTIGAVEFESLDRFEAYIGPDGYFYSSRPPELGSPAAPTVYDYLAPVSLPEGAEIQRMCLYANDSNLQDNVGIVLLAAQLTTGGIEPDTKHIGTYIISAGAVGYRRYCADFTETIRSRIDVDEDGTLDPVTYYIRADLRSSEEDQHLGIGGAQITWRRQISPPPSAPTFGDVPESHPFRQFIEALAASGVTGGCGNGNFCPDAPLKRGQMAVFLAKALGLHWPD